ncbi:MAG: GNAT family N-acetyltransferase [Clostridiales bacterium]|nr:GNAT family N-acetyltransferase [Clostridiales bacterium]
MIKLVDDDKLLYDFCAKDPFGAHIAAYRKAYGDSVSEIMFWVQLIDGVPRGAISRVDGAVTVCADAGADHDELREFLDFMGFSSLKCELSVMCRLGYNQAKTGSVVRFIGRKNYCNTALKCDFTDDYKTVFDILKKCGFDGLDNYSLWIADISHRCRHNVTKIMLGCAEGKKVTCASALFVTDNIAFLGAVGTLPEYRGHGFACEIVGTLADIFKNEGKNVYLFCKDKLVPFYEKVGFIKDGSWAIAEKI